MKINPVTFTDAAVTHIKKMQAQTPDSIGFRLAVKKSGCTGYAYVPAMINTVMEGDETYIVQQDLAIFIEPASLPFLQEVVVDYVVDEVAGLKQKRLVFINPNEKARCGCGESFTIE
jgi:iron-sulfur cluster assembly protein